MDTPPAPTGKPPGWIALAGKLFAVDRDTPVLFEMPGSEHFYLPTFANEPELRAAMERTGSTVTSIKRIDDGPAFVESVPAGVKVITDLRFLPNGRIRYVLVLGTIEDAKGLNG